MSNSIRTDDRSTIGRIAASVVCFHPDPDALSQLLCRLHADFDEVILVDNGGGARAVEGTPWPVAISNDQNCGLSVGLDAAFAEAQRRRCTWVVHFDQDSFPEAGYCEIRDVLCDVDGAVAALGGGYVDHNVADRARMVSSRRPTTPIASGTAFRITAWRDVGGFEHRVPVDLFDFWYALRLQEAGYSVLVTPALCIRHQIGDRKTVQIGPLRLSSPGHVDWRWYLKLDASARIAKRFGTVFPAWVARHLLARCLELLGDVVIGDTRRATWLMLGRWLIRRPPPEVRELYRASTAADSETYGAIARG